MFNNMRTHEMENFKIPILVFN